MNLYKVGRALVSLVLFPLYRVKVEGKANVPKKGPVIICSNHISNLDPPVVGMTAPRDIYFMAKEELFHVPVLKKILPRIQVFPIKRGMKDRNALRKGLEILGEGKVLGLFPEGTRSKTGELGQGLSGAGFFAARSEAYIVPCAIIGPYKPFRRLKVVYGKPLDMDEYRKRKAPAKEVTDVIMEEIRLLMDRQR